METTPNPRRRRSKKTGVKKVLGAHLTLDEFEIVERAAALFGNSLSSFAAQCLVEKSLELIMADQARKAGHPVPTLLDRLLRR